eukprot:scaffold97867_cov33-Prasinocladus_malaysianus.AAC.3
MRGDTQRLTENCARKQERHTGRAAGSQALAIKHQSPFRAAAGRPISVPGCPHLAPPMPLARVAPPGPPLGSLERLLVPALDCTRSSGTLSGIEVSPRPLLRYPPRCPRRADGTG